MTNPETFQLSRPHLEADIYYFTQGEGGRQTAPASGYRGTLYYNGQGFSAMQQFLNEPWCQLGETVRVRLQLATPALHAGQFYVGQAFDIREGSKTVGRGVVTSVLQDDFIYWDTTSFLKQLPPGITPYAGDNLDGYRIDFDYFLTDSGLFSYIAFDETGQKECMLRVRCKLECKDLSPHDLVQTMTNTWRNELAIMNQLYKIGLETKPDSQSDKLLVDRFVLTFATWNSSYLTGQILVTA